MKATLNQLIRAYCIREHQPQWVEIIYQGYLDVASGTRTGNSCERHAIAYIFSRRGRNDLSPLVTYDKRPNRPEEA